MLSPSCPSRSSSLRPPGCPLFPYTTLFRSLGPRTQGPDPDGRHPPLLVASRSDPGSEHAADEEQGPHQGRRRRGHHRLRSEEHTSELQSLTNLVCRLLLEKKKDNNESGDDR